MACPAPAQSPPNAEAAASTNTTEPETFGSLFQSKKNEAKGEVAKELKGNGTTKAPSQKSIFVSLDGDIYLQFPWLGNPEERALGQAQHNKFLLDYALGSSPMETPVGAAGIASDSPAVNWLMWSSQSNVFDAIEFSQWCGSAVFASPFTHFNGGMGSRRTAPASASHLTPTPTGAADEANAPFIFTLPLRSSSGISSGLPASSVSTGSSLATLSLGVETPVATNAVAGANLAAVTPALSKGNAVESELSIRADSSTPFDWTVWNNDYLAVTGNFQAPTPYAYTEYPQWNFTSGDTAVDAGGNGVHFPAAGGSTGGIAISGSGTTFTLSNVQVGYFTTNPADGSSLQAGTFTPSNLISVYSGAQANIVGTGTGGASNALLLTVPDEWRSGPQAPANNYSIDVFWYGSSLNFSGFNVTTIDSYGLLARYGGSLQFTGTNYTVPNGAPALIIRGTVDGTGVNPAYGNAAVVADNGGSIAFNQTGSAQIDSPMLATANGSLLFNGTASGTTAKSGGTATLIANAPITLNSGGSLGLYGYQSTTLNGPLTLSNYSTLDVVGTGDPESSLTLGDAAPLLATGNSQARITKLESVSFSAAVSANTSGSVSMVGTGTGSAYFGNGLSADGSGAVSVSGFPYISLSGKLQATNGGSVALQGDPANGATLTLSSDAGLVVTGLGTQLSLQGFDDYRFGGNSTLNVSGWGQIYISGNNLLSSALSLNLSAPMTASDGASITIAGLQDVTLTSGVSALNGGQIQIHGLNWWLSTASFGGDLQSDGNSSLVLDQFMNLTVAGRLSATNGGGLNLQGLGAGSTLTLSPGAALVASGQNTSVYLANFDRYDFGGNSQVNLSNGSLQIYGTGDLAAGGSSLTMHLSDPFMASNSTIVTIGSFTNMNIDATVAATSGSSVSFIGTGPGTANFGGQLQADGSGTTLQVAQNRNAIITGGILASNAGTVAVSGWGGNGTFSLGSGAALTASGLNSVIGLALFDQYTFASGNSLTATDAGQITILGNSTGALSDNGFQWGAGGAISADSGGGVLVNNIRNATVASPLTATSGGTIVFNGTGDGTGSFGGDFISDGSGSGVYVSSYRTVSLAGSLQATAGGVVGVQGQSNQVGNTLTVSPTVSLTADGSGSLVSLALFDAYHFGGGAVMNATNGGMIEIVGNGDAASAGPAFTWDSGGTMTAATGGNFHLYNLHDLNLNNTITAQSGGIVLLSGTNTGSATLGGNVTADGAGSSITVDQNQTINVNSNLQATNGGALTLQGAGVGSSLALGPTAALSADGTGSTVVLSQFDQYGFDAHTALSATNGGKLQISGNGDAFVSAPGLTWSGGGALAASNGGGYGFSNFHDLTISADVSALSGGTVSFAGTGTGSATLGGNVMADGAGSTVAVTQELTVNLAGGAQATNGGSVTMQGVGVGSTLNLTSAAGLSADGTGSIVALSQFDQYAFTGTSALSATSGGQIRISGNGDASASHQGFIWSPGGTATVANGGGYVFTNFHDLAIDSAFAATTGGTALFTGTGTGSATFGGGLSADGAGSAISVTQNPTVQVAGDVQATNGGALTLQGLGAGSVLSLSPTAALVATGSGTLLNLSQFDSYAFGGSSAINLTNGGHVQITGNGDVVGGSTLTLTLAAPLAVANSSGVTVSGLRDVTIGNNVSASSGSTIALTGTGTGTTTLGGGVSADGVGSTVAVTQAPTVSIGGGLAATNGGTISVEGIGPGSSATFSPGAFTADGSGSSLNLGQFDTYSFGPGNPLTVTNGGSIVVTGTGDSSGSTLTIAGANTLQAASGSSLAFSNFHSIGVDSDLSVQTGGAITFTGTGTGTVTIGGGLSADGAGSHIAVTNTGQLSLGGVLLATNGGAISLQGSGPGSTATFVPGAFAADGAGSALTLGSFDNYTFGADNPLSATAGGSIQVTGTGDAHGSTLALAGGATLQATSGSSLAFSNFHTISVDSAIATESGGAITFTGTGTGTTTIGGGLSADGAGSRIAFTQLGQMSLGGALQATNGGAVIVQGIGPGSTATFSPGVFTADGAGSTLSLGQFDTYSFGTGNPLNATNGGSIQMTGTGDANGSTLSLAGGTTLQATSGSGLSFSNFHTINVGSALSTQSGGGIAFTGTGSGATTLGGGLSADGTGSHIAVTQVGQLSLGGALSATSGGTITLQGSGPGSTASFAPGAFTASGLGSTVALGQFDNYSFGAANPLSATAGGSIQLTGTGDANGSTLVMSGGNTLQADTGSALAFSNFHTISVDSAIATESGGLITFTGTGTGSTTIGGGLSADGSGSRIAATQLGQLNLGGVLQATNGGTITLQGSGPGSTASFAPGAFTADGTDSTLTLGLFDHYTFGADNPLSATAGGSIQVNGTGDTTGSTLIISGGNTLQADTGSSLAFANFHTITVNSAISTQNGGVITFTGTGTGTTEIGGGLSSDGAGSRIAASQLGQLSLGGSLQATNGGTITLQGSGPGSTASFVPGAFTASGLGSTVALGQFDNYSFGAANPLSATAGGSIQLTGTGDANGSTLVMSGGNTLQADTGSALAFSNFHTISVDSAIATESGGLITFTGTGTGSTTIGGGLSADGSGSRIAATQLGQLNLGGVLQATNGGTITLQGSGPGSTASFAPGAFTADGTDSTLTLGLFDHYTFGAENPLSATSGGSIQVNGTGDTNGSTLTLAGGATLQADTGSSLAFSNFHTITVDSAVTTLSGGVVTFTGTGSGTTTIGGGLSADGADSRITATQLGQLSLGGALLASNGGTITLQGSGPGSTASFVPGVFAASGTGSALTLGQFDNYTFGTANPLSATAGGSIQVTGTGDATGSALNISGGSTLQADSGSSLAFSNFHTINVKSAISTLMGGVVSFTGTGTGTTTIGGGLSADGVGSRIAATQLGQLSLGGALLATNGGSITLQGAGPGSTIAFVPGALSANGTGSTLTLGSFDNYTFGASNSLAASSGGTISVAGTGDSSGSTLTLSNGLNLQTTAQSTLSFTGFHTLNLASTLSAFSGSTISIAGTDNGRATLSGSLSANGVGSVVTVSPVYTGNVGGSLTVADGGAVNVQSAGPGSIFNLAATASVSATDSGSKLSLIQFDQYNLTSGAMVSAIDSGQIAFSGNGLSSSLTPGLVLNSGATLSATTGGSVLVTNEQALQLSGTVSAQSGGTVSLAAAGYGSDTIGGHLTADGSGSAVSVTQQFSSTVTGGLQATNGGVVSLQGMGNGGTLALGSTAQLSASGTGSRLSLSNFNYFSFTGNNLVAASNGGQIQLTGDAAYFTGTPDLIWSAGGTLSSDTGGSVLVSNFRNLNLSSTLAAGGGGSITFTGTGAVNGGTFSLGAPASVTATGAGSVITLAQYDHLAFSSSSALTVDHHGQLVISGNGNYTYSTPGLRWDAGSTGTATNGGALLISNLETLQLDASLSATLGGTIAITGVGPHPALGIGYATIGGNWWADGVGSSIQMTRTPIVLQTGQMFATGGGTIAVQGTDVSYGYLTVGSMLANGAGSAITLSDFDHYTLNSGSSLSAMNGGMIHLTGLGSASSTSIGLQTTTASGSVMAASGGSVVLDQLKSIYLLVPLNVQSGGQILLNGTGDGSASLNGSLTVAGAGSTLGITRESYITLFGSVQAQDASVINLQTSASLNLYSSLSVKSGGIANLTGSGTSSAGLFGLSADGSGSAISILATKTIGTNSIAAQNAGRIGIAGAESLQTVAISASNAGSVGVVGLLGDTAGLAGVGNLTSTGPGSAIAISQMQQVSGLLFSAAAGGTISLQGTGTGSLTAFGLTADGVGSSIIANQEKAVTLNIWGVRGAVTATNGGTVSLQGAGAGSSLAPATMTASGSGSTISVGAFDNFQATDNSLLPGSTSSLWTWSAIAGGQINLSGNGDASPGTLQFSGVNFVVNTGGKLNLTQWHDSGISNQVSVASGGQFTLAGTGTGTASIGDSRIGRSYGVWADGPGSTLAVTQDKSITIYNPVLATNAGAISLQLGGSGGTFTTTGVTASNGGTVALGGGASGTAVVNGALLAFGPGSAITLQQFGSISVSPLSVYQPSIEAANGGVFSQLGAAGTSVSLATALEASGAGSKVSLLNDTSVTLSGGANGGAVAIGAGAVVTVALNTPVSGPILFQSGSPTAHTMTDTLITQGAGAMTGGVVNLTGMGLGSSITLTPTDTLNSVPIIYINSDGAGSAVNITQFEQFQVPNLSQDLLQLHAVNGGTILLSGVGDSEYSVSSSLWTGLKGSFTAGSAGSSVTLSNLRDLTLDASSTLTASGAISLVGTGTGNFNLNGTWTASGAGATITVSQPGKLSLGAQLNAQFGGVITLNQNGSFPLQLDATPGWKTESSGAIIVNGNGTGGTFSSSSNTTSITASGWGSSPGGSLIEFNQTGSLALNGVRFYAQDYGNIILNGTSTGISTTAASGTGANLVGTAGFWAATGSSVSILNYTNVNLTGDLTAGDFSNVLVQGTGSGNFSISYLSSFDPPFSSSSHGTVTISNFTSFNIDSNSGLQAHNSGTVSLIGTGSSSLTFAPGSLITVGQSSAAIFTGMGPITLGGTINTYTGGRATFSGNSIDITGTVNALSGGQAVFSAPLITVEGTLFASGAGSELIFNNAISLTGTAKISATNGAYISIPNLTIRDPNYNWYTDLSKYENYPGVTVALLASNGGTFALTPFSPTNNYMSGYTLAGDPSGTFNINVTQDNGFLGQLLVANTTAYIRGAVVNLSGSGKNLVINGLNAWGGSTLNISNLKGLVVIPPLGYPKITYGNGSTGTWDNVTTGGYVSPTTGALVLNNNYTGNQLSSYSTIQVDFSSTLNLHNSDFYNTQWQIDGTVNISGTVRDGGFLSGFDPVGSGGGMINILANATLTTVNQINTNSWGNHGHPGITLTGQGTANQMYPVNDGTILSPSTGVLTINALAGQTWTGEQVDPTVSPLPTQPGGSQTFFNMADGKIVYRGGDIIFHGFSNGIDNQGGIEVHSNVSMLGDNAFSSHIFSTGGNGTMLVDSGATWSIYNPAASSSKLEYQNLTAQAGGAMLFNGFDLNHVNLTAVGGGIISLTGIGSASLDAINQLTMGDRTGTIYFAGRGAGSTLTLTNSNLALSNPNGPAVSISGFANYIFAGTGNVVSGGTLFDLTASTGIAPTGTLPLGGGGSLNPGGGGSGSTVVTMSGTLTFKNDGSGTLHDMNIGDATPYSAPTHLIINSDSSVTVKDSLFYNTVCQLNGVMYIVNNVYFAGDPAVKTSNFFSGLGTINVTDGALLTDYQDLGTWDSSALTFTGQGTIRRMNPENYGTFISDTAGVLTIVAIPATGSTDPRIASGGFINHANASIRIQSGGGINFTGFAGPMSNDGLILGAGSTTWDAAAGNGFNWFTSTGPNNGSGQQTIEATGSGVTFRFKADPSASSASVQNQWLVATQSGTLQFDNYTISNSKLQADNGGTLKINTTPFIAIDPSWVFGDTTGKLVLVGAGTTSGGQGTLQFTNLNLVTGLVNRPTLSVSNFTTINLAGTNNTVNGGPMIDLPGLTDASGNKYTTLSGYLPITNSGSATLHDLNVGAFNGTGVGPQPARTNVIVDNASTVTVKNTDTFNTNWIVNGTLYIDGTVRDGGYNTGLYGSGTMNILAGATMTTISTDPGSRWNAGGLLFPLLDANGQAVAGQYTRFTLTGQGTADRMYPINHGNILSPTSGGLLTIKALPSGSWVNDPINPLPGSSRTFTNFSDGVIRYAGNGGINFAGFTDGIDNRGLIEVLSNASLALTNGITGHLFSSSTYGTFVANGPSVLIAAGATNTDGKKALVESQNIYAINGATIALNDFNFNNVVLSNTPVNPGDTAGQAFRGGNLAPVLGTIGTATQDVFALSTLTNATLTGNATVLRLLGNESISLDASMGPLPGHGAALTVTNGAQFQLVGDGRHTVYGTLTNSVDLNIGSLGAGISRIQVDSGGSILGAGNVTPNQFGLTLGNGGTLIVRNPNLSTVGVNLANAPVLPAPFSFSAARAPGSTTAGSISAAGLPGANANQTLTLLGDIQMAANSTLNVTIFGNNNNANSLLMAGTAGTTAASTLSGNLSVSVTPGLALTSNTLFVVFQENGAGFGSSRFGNAPSTGSTLTSADGNWLFGVNYVGNQVILGNATAVPEPSTSAVLLAAAGIVMTLFRRSRKVSIQPDGQPEGNLPH